MTSDLALPLQAHVQQSTNELSTHESSFVQRITRYTPSNCHLS